MDGLDEPTRTILMSKKDKKVKIEFAPGCFDNVDLTQEELDGIVAMLENMTEEEFLANSTELTDEDINDIPDEVVEQLFNQSKRTLQ